MGVVNGCAFQCRAWFPMSTLATKLTIADAGCSGSISANTWQALASDD